MVSCNIVSFAVFNEFRILSSSMMIWHLERIDKDQITTACKNITEAGVLSVSPSQLQLCWMSDAQTSAQCMCKSICGVNLTPKCFVSLLSLTQMPQLPWKLK